jgi:phage terminase large subunit
VFQEEVNHGRLHGATRAIADVGCFLPRSSLLIDLMTLPQWVNDTFYPLISNTSRYLILYGGAGSGKSVFAAQKTVVRILSERPHKILVVRKVAKTLRQSCFAEIQSIISQWGLSEYFTVNKTDMEISCRNGNRIIFAGLDDVEKLKSIQGITSIWEEEASELEQADHIQLDLRLRGRTKHYKQIIQSFNPVSITHWLRDTIDQDQTTAHRSTYKDNRFIDAEYIRLIESFKITDEYYYTVYGLGEWGVTGKTIFPAAIVTQRINELRGRRHQSGMFELDQWTNGDYVRMYHDPETGLYVLGGDTAGEGSDYFTGQVLDQDGNQCAVLQHKFDEDLYAQQMYALGRYYNDALLAIECNFSSYPIKELDRLQYPNQYVRETAPDSYTGKLSHKYGFMTTKLTRPLIISNLVKHVRESIETINDIPTLEEMLTFVRNEHGRAEAMNNKHDDLIMALAIAEYIRNELPVDSIPFLPGKFPQARKDFDDDDDDDIEPKARFWAI